MSDVLSEEAIAELEALVPHLIGIRMDGGSLEIPAGPGIVHRLFLRPGVGFSGEQARALIAAAAALPALLATARREAKARVFLAALKEDCDAYVDNPDGYSTPLGIEHLGDVWRYFHGLRGQLAALTEETP